jgi:Golgi nucleoside diphosphatase
VSTFSQNPEKVGPDHLQPLLDHVIDVVPSHSAIDTPVFLLATAGMRLLADHEQKRLLQNICSYLREKSNFMLPDCQVHVQVIDGKTEGLYGWIAANYLLGGFDKPEKHDHGKGHHTYGFLDMGGASAQIAFAPNATEAKKHANDLTLLRLRTVNGSPAEHRVFVTSWLGFGVRQARNRYVKDLIKTVEPGSEKQHPDPCLPSGLRTTVDGGIMPPGSPLPEDGPYLVGTGNFDDCLHRTIPLLEKDAPCEDQPCLLNGVHVPAIDFDVNHFVGISEYWHTTHEIFEMGHKDKAYDFHTYQLRVREFCNQDWKQIEAGILDSKWGKHVDQEKANEVCFKAAWIINMLHDGIGVPRVGIEASHASGLNTTTEVVKQGKDKGFLDPFQAVNKVGSTEVSWTLGKAVLYASSQVPPAGNTLPVGFGSNVPGIPPDFQYPASPRLPIPVNDMPQSANNTSEHWHDALFDGDSPRRIPGVFLFAFIVVMALFFLCGRERRVRAYRRLYRSLGRSGGSHRKRGGGLSIFGRKIPWFGRRTPSYDRVLEEGMRDFELGDSTSDSDGDSFDATSGTTPVGLSKSSSSVWGNNQTLKYGFDNTSTQSLGSGLEIGLSPYDRNGLVIRTESRDRLLPVALGPTSNGRKSRATSPVRLKPPFPPP